VGWALKSLEGSLTIYDALLGDTPMADTVRPTLCEGLEMVTADKNLVAANLDLWTCLTGIEAETALQPVRDKYDYILIDCRQPWIY